MEQMQSIAEALRQNNNVLIGKDKLKDTIDKMAKPIYEYQLKNGGTRTYEKVFEHCEFVAIEYALAWALKGRRNPHEFDPKVAETYYWDVETTSAKTGQNIKFECKRWKREGGGFFSYAKTGLKTFLKHADKIDYVVTAKVFPDEKSYRVQFMRIMHAPSFEHHLAPSKYNDWEVYYNHFGSNPASVEI